MLEPAHLFALLERGIAGHDIGPAVAQMQQHVEKMEPDAGNQNGGDRHQVTACPPAAIVVAITARSFLQNSLSTRFSATGLTFQVSPEM